MRWTYEHTKLKYNIRGWLDGQYYSGFVTPWEHPKHLANTTVFDEIQPKY